MRKIFVFTAAALLASTAFAAGEIYRWKDASGAWHYSDQPHDGAEIIRSTPNGSTPATAAMPAPAPVAAPPASATTSSALPVSKEVAAEVRQAAATSKAETCKKAEEEYQKSIRALRVYTTDDKGVRTYLPADKADESRLQARATRDLACTP